jgi:plastocyanin
MKTHAPLLTLAAALALAACGDQPSDASAAPAGRAEAVAGRVIEVKMVTDERGNYFEPAQVTARRGDVLRLTLVSGVHNLSFPAELNPPGAALPRPTDFLQIAGQRVDVPITMAPGEYTFHCAPHAPFGMTGKLTVG